MPPITSRRPGARETRTLSGVPPNSGNSSRRRRSSVGTGSRPSGLARRSGRGPGAGLGDGGGGCIDNFRLLPLEHDLAGQPTPARLEPDLEHVAAVLADLRERELELVGAADP